MKVYSKFFTTKIQHQTKAFRMNKNISKKLAKRKQKISKKLNKRNWTDQAAPCSRPPTFNMKLTAVFTTISQGGIRLMYMLAGKTGLLKEIDRELELLKHHLPCHGSDHIDLAEFIRTAKVT